MARRKQPVIPDAIIDQLLCGADPQTAFAKDGLLDELKKALAERALNAEMDQHLAGSEDNSRNGYGSKTVLTGTGKIVLDIPRDRQSSFDPQLIAKYQRRFPGFDEKIVSMYARGMSVREIQGHLRELYGIDASPDLVSAVTDAVLEEISEWQNRPLEALYPLVFFDAIRVKIRDEGRLTVEEAKGQVRWLRPDYQIPKFGSDWEKARLEEERRKAREEARLRPQQGALPMEDDLREMLPRGAAARPTFPTGNELAETAAIMSVLAGARGPMTIDAIAQTFSQGLQVRRRVALTVLALARLGHLASPDDGDSFTLRRAA